MFRGPKGIKWGAWGSYEVKRDVWGIPWSHPIRLMRPMMIHKAYLPVYKWSRWFFLRVHGSTGGSTRHSREPKKEPKRQWAEQGIALVHSSQGKDEPTLEFQKILEIHQCNATKRILMAQYLTFSNCSTFTGYDQGILSGMSQRLYLWIIPKVWVTTSISGS